MDSLSICALSRHEQTQIALESTENIVNYIYIIKYISE